MKTSIVKRSLVIDGHKTSVSLEDQFWAAFKQMGAERGKTLNDLALEIDKARTHGNLSSAIRLAVFAHFDKRGAQQEAA